MLSLDETVFRQCLRGEASRDMGSRSYPHVWVVVDTDGLRTDCHVLHQQEIQRSRHRGQRLILIGAG